MNFQSFLLFYPERILWIGFALLGGIFLLSSPFLILHWQENSPTIDVKNMHLGDRKITPLKFSLGLETKNPAFPVPDLEGEMTFSFDPPRPDGVLHRPQLLVRLKRSAQSKRISLPCRMDLQYSEGEKLIFGEGETPFWIELSPAAGGQIEGVVNIFSPLDGKAEPESFFAQPQESPIRSVQEFAEGSPFRFMAEARWWGHDLFREKYGEGAYCERLEIGPVATADLIELCENDWMIWQEGHWQKASSLSDGKGKPIAHIQSIQGKTLFLEGWDNDSHFRISLSPAASVSFKVKGEELFSSIRIRSEKQISCTLEKQCLILKTGDWVLKRDGRWKVLRKKEEREAYLNGKLIGDLFVFEKIELKQGQKYIQGQFFNPGRSQLVPIEVAAHLMRKSSMGKESIATGEKAARKGKLR